MTHKVLVIEDNAQNMYLIHFLLESQGYTVIEAENGVIGIQKAKEEKPEIILLDIQLPEMDGYEIARIIRSTPGIDTIPIIAVTSYAMAGDKERILAAGATDYIEKPINPATFVDQIKVHFKTRE
ncbi:response regulator [Methanospirillum hungatei]|jgi:CheY-like chemotaxis protein|uniref:response regulator n=1 Tax=Methanospirillum hungatei TaxID=2203 RepID=UPI001B55A369|nr:response regulator [Methanospirillum hungatei]MBP9009461.1 response regulator [Methanospirillum sp.]HOW04052.1 response regulator [Methanospirillum hungatei]